VQSLKRTPLTQSLDPFVSPKMLPETAPFMMRLVASSISAAATAGVIIREVMKTGDLGVVSKGINDLQTEADRSVQACIVTSLSSKFPGITIIGEEGNLEPSSSLLKKTVTEVASDFPMNNCPDNLKSVNESDVVVWVDPLDGTSEYTQGLLEHVTVLIGIAVKDRPVGGVIHQPYYNYKNGVESEIGRTIWGVEGIGIGGFSPQPPAKDKFIITTTRSHSNELVESIINHLKPDDVLRVGGAGHKVLMLLEGKAHAYVFPTSGTKRWDTCGPEAVLHAFGGKLTNVHGQYYDYNKDTPHLNADGILAAVNVSDHSKCLEAIKKYLASKK